MAFVHALTADLTHPGTDTRQHVTALPDKVRQHFLQYAKNVSPNEYNDIEETMSPTALKINCDWVSLKTHSRVKADR
jgi:hypothetical protein